MIDSIYQYDVVIIGGGLSGLRASIESSKQNIKIALLSKVHPLRSHSVAAQGGINAALGNAIGGEKDSWKDHVFDTVKGSDYLADQNAAELLCKNAPDAVFELEQMGTVFSRRDDGRIAQRPFGGAFFPRTCYASDRTGHNLLNTLYEQTIDEDIDFFDEYFVTRLVVEKNKCIGCIALNISDGALNGFAAKTTLLATGGYGRVFARSTNALINTGDGSGLALKAGIPLKDVEFVQFHPTTLYGSNILITEGARGEGGYLYNNQHERFMKDYASKSMELAPRDIVARAIQNEINVGRGFENEYVHLDLTHLGAEKIKQRLPGIRLISMDFAGVDPIERPIPIQPGQHYSMGGVETNNDCSTSMSGLFATGEASCVSVHGANRLGGNSLLETIVFGKIAGDSMSAIAKKINKPSIEEVEKTLKSEEKRIYGLLNRDSGERMHEIRDDLKKIMFNNFGIFREEKKMQEGFLQILKIKKRFQNVHIHSTQKTFNQALVHTLELEYLIAIAEVIGKGALARKESRGSHFRTDYPLRNDHDFLVHTMAYYHDGKIIIDYAPVNLGIYPVKERTY